LINFWVNPDKNVPHSNNELGAPKPKFRITLLALH